MKRHIVPDVVSGEQEVLSVGPNSTVKRASELMCAKHVAAAAVLDGEKLVGIVTERDLVFRVMAKGLDPENVLVSDVMTAQPKTIGPNEQAADALSMMRNGHFRHLPVIDDGIMIGMVSIRDLYEAVSASLEEDLQNAETLIYGEQYGGLSA